MKPDLVEIKGGWAAVAKTWAVFGKTQEEAMAKFAEREPWHLEIESRPEPNPKDADLEAPQSA